MKIVMVLPNDKTILEKKYSEVLANIVANRLSHEELGYLIEKLEEKKLKESKN